MFLPRIRTALVIFALSASLAGCATGRGYVGAEAGPTSVR
jgi:hypothetical protein